MSAVKDPLPHAADFQFAQKCLAGEESALLRLRENFAPSIVAYLIRIGARIDLAHEIADRLWADCLTAPFGRSAPLARYDGSCALLTWFNTIAMHRFVSRCRAEQRWLRVMPVRTHDARSDENLHAIADRSTALETESPLLEILRTAVQKAFAQCPPEQFVLLELIHRDGLRHEDLAKMFCCSDATIRRKVDAAARDLQEATLTLVKAADPLIELTWDDFLDLCRTASPSLFEFE